MTTAAQADPPSTVTQAADGPAKRFSIAAVAFAMVDGKERIYAALRVRPHQTLDDTEFDLDYMSSSVPEAQVKTMLNVATVTAMAFDTVPHDAVALRYQLVEE